MKNEKNAAETQNLIYHYPKYEDIYLIESKQFLIKDYKISSLKEYILVFNIYENEILFSIAELLKTDIKSKSLIKSNYESKFDKMDLLTKFSRVSGTNNFQEIYQFISRKIYLNKIQINISKSNSLFFIINDDKNKEILKLQIPKISDIKNNNFEKYQLNPIFKNKKIITDSCEGYYSLNNSFEVFYSFQDCNEIFLAFQNNDTNNIDIIKLTNSQLIISLKNIQNKITTIKHFFNVKTKFDYLIITDTNNDIKIWNISLNYKLIAQFNNGDSIGNISSSLLLFPDYILITSIYGKKNDDYTKIYNFNEKSGKNICEFKKNIKGSNNLLVSYLLIWENNNKKYLIQLSYYKVLINDIVDEKNSLYWSFDGIENNEKLLFYCGYIVNKRFLITNTKEGYIFLIDLENKIIVNKLKISYNLYNSLLWSDNYIIFAAQDSNNTKKCFIKIMDIYQFKIISNLNYEILEGITTVKKITHPDIGNCLLTFGTNNKIIIFSP